ncbi:hypothetical protein [Paenibacillus humicola]|uniref:hypothetical protein n=1 Tax=Paenibacillus humicola TaxID=3110540 RepID=UPI00237AB802|nr:hypothetical protein [Paenibacillus humicola]
MAQKFNITKLVLADRSKESGLYHFVATMSDNTQCRMIYTRNPDWKLIDVNRLLTVPCPICRKDYYCNCLARHTDELERQVADKQLIQEV